MRLLESRLDPSTGLFLIGDAANLLAPSAGAWLLPNGTRAPAWLTGVSVSYAAAMDRVVELRRLVGDDAGAARDAAKRDAAIAALPQVREEGRAAPRQLPHQCLILLCQLLAPSGDYFVKWADPDGPPHTLHGVLGQVREGEGTHMRRPGTGKGRFDEMGGAETCRTASKEGYARSGALCEGLPLTTATALRRRTATSRLS